MEEDDDGDDDKSDDDDDDTQLSRRGRNEETMEAVMLRALARLRNVG